MYLLRIPVSFPYSDYFHIGLPSHRADFTEDGQARCGLGNLRIWTTKCSTDHESAPKGKSRYNLRLSSSLTSQLLQGAHDKLNRKLSPPTAIDPLSQLPIEIAEMIIGYLRFYEIV
jgi:hypothetical protein